MMPGMPGGRQLAVSLSSRACARSASRLAAYSGVNCGPAGVAPRAPAGAAPRPAAGAVPLAAGGPAACAPAGAVAAPRPPPSPRPTSQTPVKSGNFPKNNYSSPQQSAEPEPSEPTPLCASLQPRPNCNKSDNIFRGFPLVSPRSKTSNPIFRNHTSRKFEGRMGIIKRGLDCIPWSCPPSRSGSVIAGRSREV